MVAEDFVDVEVVFKQGDRIDGCTLVDENEVLAVLVRLSPGKTKDACVRVL